MKELAGGLWCAGLLAGALFGLGAGVIFFILGAICGACELVKLKQAEKAEQNWRAEYPSYKY
jgi:hypothetical protein